MHKVNSLRHHLTTLLPELARNPDSLVIFAEGGTLRLTEALDVVLEDGKRCIGWCEEPSVGYPARELLGVTEKDRADLLDAVEKHLMGWVSGWPVWRNEELLAAIISATYRVPHSP